MDFTINSDPVSRVKPSLLKEAQKKMINETLNLPMRWPQRPLTNSVQPGWKCLCIAKLSVYMLTVLTYSQVTQAVSRKVYKCYKSSYHFYFVYPPAPLSIEPPGAPRPPV